MWALRLQRRPRSLGLSVGLRLQCCPHSVGLRLHHHPHSVGLRLQRYPRSVGLSLLHRPCGGFFVSELSFWRLTAPQRWTDKHDQGPGGNWGVERTFSGGGGGDWQ